MAQPVKVLAISECEDMNSISRTHRVEVEKQCRLTSTYVLHDMCTHKQTQEIKTNLFKKKKKVSGNHSKAFNKQGRPQLYLANLVRGLKNNNSLTS